MVEHAATKPCSVLASDTRTVQHFANVQDADQALVRLDLALEKG